MAGRLYDINDEQYECHIANGSTWEQHDAYIDNGSSYEVYGDLSVIFLYLNGDECEDVTGGWETAKTCSGSITKGSQSISLSLNGIPTYSSYGVINTINKIDLTDIKELTINEGWIVKEDNNNVRPIFGVKSSKPRSASEIGSGAKMTSGTVLNVSSLSGSYYVYVGCPMQPEYARDVTLKVTDIGMS